MNHTLKVLMTVEESMLKGGFGSSTRNASNKLLDATSQKLRWMLIGTKQFFGMLHRKAKKIDKACNRNGCVTALNERTIMS